MSEANSTKPASDEWVENPRKTDAGAASYKINPVGLSVEIIETVGDRMRVVACCYPRLSIESEKPNTRAFAERIVTYLNGQATCPVCEAKQSLSETCDAMFEPVIPTNDQFANEMGNPIA